MEAYAVVETGGKQYRVTVGEKLEIERLDAEVGADVEIRTVRGAGYALEEQPC